MLSREPLLASLLLAVSLAGCSAPAPSAPAGHGAIDGAAEATEPQLHLATADADGSLGLLDLVSGGQETIAELGEVAAMSTDGRFVFAAAPGGVTIVDTGVWTVPHGDHSHYYRAQPRLVGAVDGEGVPEVTTGSSLTAVRFGDSGILLDTEALGRGEIAPRFEVAGAELIATIGSAALVAGSGSVGVLSDTGAGQSAPCRAPAGTITTRAATVIGCADGALLVTESEGAVSFRHVPYPSDEPRALAFAARKDRPTVAAVSGDSGAWLLDSREGAWRHLATEQPLLRAVAVDDAAERVVALGADGRVLTLDARTGALTATTEPLLPQSLHDPVALRGVELTVDADRAYLNAPAEGVVYEIDYRDGARIARTFDIDAVHLAETGR